VGFALHRNGGRLMSERAIAFCIGLLVTGTLGVPLACLRTECGDPSGRCASLPPSGRRADASAGVGGAAGEAGAAAEGGTRAGGAGGTGEVGGEGGSGSIETPGCGDGWVDAGETCDDGARSAGDGCDPSCQLESGWLCGGDPSQCVDVDECATNNGGCDPLTACSNEPGTFSCSPCPPSHLGDGSTGCAAATVLASSNVHACAIKADGTLLCWGATVSGQSTPPPGTFRAVTAGYLHSCGIRTDGTVACWGDNTAGQATAPAGTFKAIAAGGPFSAASFTCGIRMDGDIRCWGGDETRITGTFRAVAAGERHACAIRTDGKVICWGNGDYGGTFIPNEWDNVRWVGLGLGPDYSCGIQTNNTASCWGSHVPEYPQGTFKALAASPIHICGIRTDDTIACFGDDYGSGQSTPPPGSFKALAVGAGHSCGLHADGKAECWGGSDVVPAPPDTFQVW
jgi:cysteine-rich repeat protein